MQINIETFQQRQAYFSKIQTNVEREQLYTIKYLDFGIKVIRVLCYTREIVLFLEQQLPFVLKNEANHFDGTIVFWKVVDIKNFVCQMDQRFNPKVNLRLRVDMLLAGHQYPDIVVMDQKFSESVPIIRFSPSEGLIEAYDIDRHCCYYAVDNLEPEEFIKHGHLFIQQLNVLLKSDSVGLTHGAVFGYGGQGALLCARGQRGKSTLTVHSLLNGCEYVSDDYQLLEKRQKNLYAYPLYSIITLSPKMYEQMYDTFDGKFCSNNARKDKYVFNISKYHSQFKTCYLIKLCLFPEIVSDKEPNIVPCSPMDKGRAIVQFIHSTVMQMRDLNDHDTIKKLFDMVVDLPFYKFNLCSDIPKNTKFLHDFLNAKQFCPIHDELPRFLVDITFGLANILDTKTNTFYSMNESATYLYQLLLSGIDLNQIQKKILSVTKDFFVDEFKRFAWALKQENLLSAQIENNGQKKGLDIDFIKKFGYNLSLLKYDANSTQDLMTERRKNDNLCT